MALLQIAEPGMSVAVSYTHLYDGYPDARCRHVAHQQTGCFHFRGSRCRLEMCIRDRFFFNDGNFHPTDLRHFLAFHVTHQLIVPGIATRLKIPYKPPIIRIGFKDNPASRNIILQHVGSCSCLLYTSTRPWNITQPGHLVIGRAKIQWT